jgi:hypothetical protein
VPTSPFLAFLQWGGRTHFVLALLQQVPEVRCLTTARTAGYYKIAVRLRSQSENYEEFHRSYISALWILADRFSLLCQVQVQGSPSVFITFMAWSISEVWQTDLTLSLSFSMLPYSHQQPQHSNCAISFANKHCMTMLRCFVLV